MENKVKQPLDLAFLAQKFIEQEARIRQLEQAGDAQEWVLAWLLHRHPEDAGHWFLAEQANELDQPQHREKYLEAIALLDHLRALVSLLPAAPVKAPAH